MFSTFFLLCLGLLAVTRPSESQRRGVPQVVTQPETFEADAGTSIRLPCEIKNVGRRSVFWFKGDSPEGRELIMQMKKVRGAFTVPRKYQATIDSGKLSTANSDLVINNLETADEDAYTCSITWARQSVTHTLTVHEGAPEAPELYLTAKPSDGQVIVGEGRPTFLSCEASGNMPTTVSWFKESHPDILNVGNNLDFYQPTREDTGRYVCRAENGVSEPVSFYFDVVVNFVEVVAEVDEVVVSGEDLMVQLSCRISGFPAPELYWHDLAGPVTDDIRHHTFSQDNIHYLQIEQMTSADLGVYGCYGYTENAQDFSLINVTAAPGPVTVLDVSRASSGQNRYTVSWEVNSLAPVKFYYVGLREGNSDEVQNSSIEGSSVPYDGQTLYRGSTEFDLTPGQPYEIMIKAVAEEYQPGPDQEEPYIFNVPNEGRVVPPHSDTHPDSEARERDDDSDATTNEDAWKWWKMSMTLMSRLPQVARMMQ